MPDKHVQYIDLNIITGGKRTPTNYTWFTKINANPDPVVYRRCP